MAMAEVTLTAFLQLPTHQQLPFNRSSQRPFFHPSARSEPPRWLRFFTRPLSLHNLHRSRLQHPPLPNNKICCNASDDALASDDGDASRLEQADAISWLQASTQESFPAEKHDFGLPEAIESSANVFSPEGNKAQSQDAMRLSPASAGGVTDSVRRRRRGRTKKTLGVPNIDTDRPSDVEQRNSIGETQLKSQLHVSDKRASDARSPSLEAKSSHNTRTAKSATSASFSDRIEEWESMIRENKFYRNSVKRESKDESNDDSHNEIRARVQELINADLERKYSEESDDEDWPLWVDEDDPNWLDEPEDGWGFRVSEFFVEKARRAKEREREDNGDAAGLDWDLEPEKWSAKEIDFTDWTETVFGDPSPLVVMLFERYGKKARENYHMLRELEAAANRIWDSHRLPPRLVKINASVEIDLVSALRVTELPMLLFIRAGKLLHRQTGYSTADEIMRMMSYFYHGAGRPSCLKTVEVPENVPRN